MGASQSAQVVEEQEEDDENEEEEDDDDDENVEKERRKFGGDNSLVKKVLEQEPEMLPCHASASPLSPQLSSFRHAASRSFHQGVGPLQCSGSASPSAAILAHFLVGFGGQR